jgi:hypothetical protein
MSLADGLRQRLEELLRDFAGDYSIPAPFRFLIRRDRRQPMPEPSKEDDTFTFIADISSGTDKEEEAPQEPVVFASPYDAPADQAPTSWAEAKARDYGPPQPPGSTTCEPGPERKADEFRQRLVYPNNGRADADPNICFGDGRPRKDELKQYAEQLSGQRVFHRPHEPIRPRSVEKQIEDL